MSKSEPAEEVSFQTSLAALTASLVSRQPMESSRILDHAKATAANKCGLGTPEYIDCLCHIAEQLRRQGLLGVSVRLFQEALEKASSSAYRTYSGYAFLLNNYALALHSMGRFEEAISHYQEALCHNSLDSWIEASVLNGLGESYRSLGRYSEALPLYRKSIELLEQHLPSSTAWLAKTESNLGLLYQDRGDSEEAAEHHERALRLLRMSGPGRTITF